MKIHESLLKENPTRRELRYAIADARKHLFFLGDEKLFDVYVTKTMRESHYNVGMKNASMPVSVNGGRDYSTIILASQPHYKDILKRLKTMLTERMNSSVNEKYLVYVPSREHDDRDRIFKRRRPDEFADVMRSIWELYEYRQDLLDKEVVAGENIFEYLYFFIILPDSVSSRLKERMRECVHAVRSCRVQVVLIANSPNQFDESVLTNCLKIFLIGDYVKYLSLFTKNLEAPVRDENLPLVGWCVDYPAQKVHQVCSVSVGEHKDIPVGERQKKANASNDFLKQYEQWIKSRVAEEDKRLASFGDNVQKPVEPKELYEEPNGWKQEAADERDKARANKPRRRRRKLKKKRKKTDYRKKSE